MKKTGNTPLNARIFVDYHKKTVRFSYPAGSGTLREKFRTVFGAMYNFLMILVILSFVFLLSVNSNVIVDAGDSFVTAVEFMLRFVAAVVVWVAVFLFITYIIANNYSAYASTFPKVQYYISRMHNDVISIRLDGIKGREFVLPTFNNVFLEYDLEGDFARYIKSVSIDDYPFDIYVAGITNKNCRMWKAVFKFSKSPKKGKMVLNFI